MSEPYSDADCLPETWNSDASETDHRRSCSPSLSRKHNLQQGIPANPNYKSAEEFPDRLASEWYDQQALSNIHPKCVTIGASNNAMWAEAEALLRGGLGDRRKEVAVFVTHLPECGRVSMGMRRGRGE